MIQEARDASALERAGCEAFPNFQLLAVSTTSSTQDVVRRAARGGALEGFCCVAAAQSSGRGRQQRAWTASPGSSLLTSVLVRPLHPRLGGVPIAAGLALRAAIESAAGCSTRLKWPNDVLAGGGKLAGILCEVEPAAPGAGTAVVIGIGVNLRVPSFPPGVTGASLHDRVADCPSASRLLAAVLPELASRLAVLATVGMGPLRSEWTRHAAGLGDTVTADSPAGRVSGVAEGIDDDGALLLRGAAGTVRVLAGDVHILGEVGGAGVPD